MKKGLRLLTVTLCVALCGSILAACGPKPSDNATYTYNESIGSAPTMWNTHTWKTDMDRYIPAYTEMNFYDTSYTNNEAGYEWVCEMAAAFPVDVTKDFSDKEKYGVPANATKNYVYKIALNPNAVFENGDKIDADTYVQSMQRLLDPKMKNFRADSWYSEDSEAALANAKKYYDSSSPIYTPVATYEGTTLPLTFVSFADTAGKDVYFSVTKRLPFLPGNYPSIAALKNAGIPFVLGEGDDAIDLVDKWSQKENQFGYIKMDADNQADLQSDFQLMVETAYGAFEWTTTTGENAWREASFTYDGVTDEYSFDNVGILKTGEYEITFVFAGAISEFNLKVSLSSINFIVHVPTYDATKQKFGELWTTKYGTSLDNYVSYGPYRLKAIQPDKEILFEKNNSWYGYTDGKHEGQFKTTNINCQIIKEHATGLQSFEKGELDTIGLTSNDMNKYRYSDYLQKTDQTYTWRYVFNTDKTALEKVKSDEKNSNVKILLQPEFRKAISYAINRDNYARETTAGERPSFVYLSDLYYYDIENNPDSVYRKTDYAKKVVTSFYGIEYGEGKKYATLDEAYKSANGYDKKKAAELMTAAWNKAVTAGDVDASKPVKLEVTIPSQTGTMTEGLTTMQNFLDQAVKDAAVGTPLEGKIGIVFKSTTSGYDLMEKGDFVMGMSAVGGAAFYPFRALGNFCEPGGQYTDYGFKPDQTMLEIEAHFNGKEQAPVKQQDTFANWANRLTKQTVEQGGFMDAEMDLKLEIMAGIELGLLNQCTSIPVTTVVDVSLISKKIKFPTDVYNIFIGYGGIRSMDYNYTDAEWAEFIKDKNNLIYD